MRVISLAAGSSGNATLVCAGTTTLLVDAGISLRGLVGRLLYKSIDPASLSAILITHEHTDHMTGVIEFASTYHLPVMSDPATLAVIRSTIPPHKDPATIPEFIGYETGATWQVGELTISSFPVPHDAVAACGYRIRQREWQMVLVTDCGAMTDTIIANMTDSHLIILEANHDRERLRVGPYPIHLKRRIMSDLGHLSNAEAASALDQCIGSQTQAIWLTHLSKTNNTPDLAIAAVTETLGADRLRGITLTVTTSGIGPTWDSPDDIAITVVE